MKGAPGPNGNLRRLPNHYITAQRNLARTPMIDMKAEKYLIYVDVRSADDGAVASQLKVRYGFGAAGEEVQKLLELAGLEGIRVKIEGKNPEVNFAPGKPLRLLDIKQKIKSLSFES